MRILLAGATGVIGRELTPMLAAAGHEVYALNRPSSHPSRIEQLGGRPVMGDLLVADDVSRAVETVHPEAVIHMATAIPRNLNPKKMNSEFAVTNQLRTTGTRNLVQAASALGVSRIIAQGIAFAYDPKGSGIAGEDTPLWRDAPRQFAEVLDALVDLERRTQDAGGLVLRFGHLYGPGTGFDRAGAVSDRIRARKFPLVGGGTAVFSFTHPHDAAAAVVAALDTNVTGTLNVVDDDPTPVRDWLPEMARMLQAPTPRPAPAMLARLVVGAWGVAYMTKLRGADNSRAKRVLDWKPRYGSWRDGF